jgi:hypothetical protein
MENTRTMFILHIIVNQELRQYLLAGSTAYTLGRRNCHILLPNHPSVSRHHATITVLPTGAAEVDNIRVQPLVLIADLSKHGTTVNAELLSNSDAHRPLHVGDTITFGTAVTARLLHAPVIVTPSPSLTDAQHKSVLNDICRLGGCMRETPYARQEILEAGVSPFATLYITELVDAHPVCLASMLEGYTAARPAFLTALLAALREAPGTEIDCLPNPHAYDVPIDAIFDGCRLNRPERCVFAPGQYAHAPLTAQGVFRSRHFVFVDGYFDERLPPLIVGGEGTFSVLTLDVILNWSAPAADERLDVALPLRGLVPEPYSHGLNVSFVVDVHTFERVEAELAAQHERERGDREPIVIAMLKLYRARYPVVSESSVAKAIASMDAAAYIIDAGVPGVLSRLAREEDDDDDTDADADSAATTDGITAFRFADKHTRAVEPLPTSGPSASHTPSTTPAIASRTTTSTAFSPTLSTHSNAGLRLAAKNDRDLYHEWLSFRRTDSALTATKDTKAGRVAQMAQRAASPTPSRAVSAMPLTRSSTPRRRIPAVPDFRADFEMKLEPMRRQVLNLADRAVTTGSLRRTDASLMNTIHQRVVNYLDWVRRDDTHKGQATDWEHLHAAQRLLNVIETTLSTCAVVSTP